MTIKPFSFGDAFKRYLSVVKSLIDITVRYFVMLR